MGGIEITDDAMKSLVAKAIFDGLSPEAREKLMTEAIASVLSEKVKREHWSSGPERTKLGEIFYTALSQCAREYVYEHVKTDSAFRDKVKGLVEANMVKIIEQLEGSIADLASEVIKNAIHKVRFE